MPSAPGSGTWQFKQGAEQAWLLYPHSKEAGSFHFERANLRSGGYHSKQTWH